MHSGWNLLFAINGSTKTTLGILIDLSGLNKLLLSLTTRCVQFETAYCFALLSLVLKWIITISYFKSIKDGLCALTSKVRCRTTFCAWAAQWHPLIWSKMSTFGFRHCNSRCVEYPMCESSSGTDQWYRVKTVIVSECRLLIRMWWEIIPSFAIITGVACIPTLAGRAWNRAVHDGLPNRFSDQ